eukprot:g2452.t1
MNSLSVYRSVLRANRLLPPMQRILGDEYVRSEFRNHQNADASFVKQFLEEWTSYADTLRKQSGESIGVPLEKDDVEAMNDDQIQQLKNLYESATKKKT